MATLTRAQILAATDRKTEVVPVPEWGGDVTIQQWSGNDRDAFESEQANGNKVGLRARIAARSIVNDSGQLLFSEADIQALSAKNGAALDRIVEAVFRTNKYTAAEQKQLGADETPPAVTAVEA